MAGKKKMWQRYWLMHHRPAGDPVGDWSIREEEDYGTVFLCLLPLHCAALRLCGKVRKHFYYCHVSRAFKPVVITFVNVLWITTFPILQDFFDSIYIHCEGFYCWRFPGCICVHPWGENTFSIHFSWYIIIFWKNWGSKGSSILLCPVKGICNWKIDTLGR